VEPQLARKYSASYIKDNLAVVHISFSENAYSGNTKNELIGFTEFLSNTGGLLGLFMGFSVISLMEIIYFLTLRPYCAGKRVDRESNFEKHRVNCRGFNRSKFIVGHEHFVRSELFQRKSTHVATQLSFCGVFQSRANSCMRNVKQKFEGVWMTFADIYKDEDTQAPYPYLN
jgi:hypothetical protein